MRYLLIHGLRVLCHIVTLFESYKESNDDVILNSFHSVLSKKDLRSLQPAEVQ